MDQEDTISGKTNIEMDQEDTISGEKDLEMDQEDTISGKKNLRMDTSVMRRSGMGGIYCIYVCIIHVIRSSVKEATNQPTTHNSNQPSHRILFIDLKPYPGVYTEGGGVIL